MSDVGQEEDVEKRIGVRTRTVENKIDKWKEVKEIKIEGE
jgi:hypothetical protein